MALSLNLEKRGHPPRKIRPTAKVKLEPDQTKSNEQAELTKKTCPISVALPGTQINLSARLVSS
jgi:hypothetical protein